MICTRAVARAIGARNSRCFAKIAGGEVRKGHTLELKGRLVRVTAVERVKPGKGGAYAQLELRDVRAFIMDVPFVKKLASHDNEKVPAGAAAGTGPLPPVPDHPSQTLPKHYGM